MTLDLSKLKELAEKATPGPRVWNGKHGSLHVVGEPPYAYGKRILYPNHEYDSGTDTVISDEDAAFIAACSPDVILELIARAEAADRFENVANKLAAEIERMRGLSIDASDLDNTMGFAP